MNCRYCQTWNAEDEHRCTRCGRRLKIADTVSYAYPASRSTPAYALAEEPAVIVEEAPPPPVLRAPIPLKLDFEEFSTSKIIPFEAFAPHRVQPVVQAPPSRSASKPQGRRRPPEKEYQSGLDFLVPAPQGPRTLKTRVEAVIYCDAEVATPKHRAIAAAIDGGMIFTGLGLFLFAFHIMGGMFRVNRQTIPFLIGVFGTLTMFYGVLWIWAGRETVGMRVTGLRLINFDGLTASRRDRLLRMAGACLSFCSGALGLLWALVDEEKLTWHDHMSKTFPTLQESNRSFFRKP